MEQPQTYSGRAPQVKPQDVMPPTGREKIDIHSAITIYRELKQPITEMKNINGLMVPHEHKFVEQEVTQLAVSWERWPVPEKYVDKALEDMCRALKEKMRETGLMK